MPTLTLLFLAANPTDTARLRVDHECRAISKALRSSEYRDQFALQNHGAVQIDDLQELFLFHRPQIVHFSGHGSPTSEIILEDAQGISQPVPVAALGQLFAILKDQVRCVVLNACDSEDQARAIAQHIDVVIGMSAGISDDASILFSTAFYRALASAQSVQTAFDLACNQLHLHNTGEQATPRLIALRTDPAGLILTASPPAAAALPSIDLLDLPAAHPETFQGRLDEIRALAGHLSGAARPRFLTLYGAPGQGKTTLARLAVERFASFWPGGVLAVSFENLPTRLDLLARLVAFLNLDPNQVPDQLERSVLQTLARRPTLLLLDNAETLPERLDRDDPAAADLAEFLQDRLPPNVTLFFTSRQRLGLPGEQSLELGGLTPDEGARLFQQCAPDVQTELDPTQLAALSRTVEGHPLSLRLLGLTYNYTGGPLPAFLQQFERHLIAAKDKYKRLDHRQRTLAACIQTSVDPLPPEIKDLLPQLTLFHAPFESESAIIILDPDSAANPAASPLPARLRQLWQRSLLDRQIHSVGKDAPLELYHLLPPIRLHVAQTAPEPTAPALQRFAQAYANLIRWIYKKLNKDPTASHRARPLALDLDRAISLCSDETRAWANYELGRIEHCLGSPWKGCARVQQALSWAREHDRKLTALALNELALICNATGQPQEALRYHREALPICKEVGDRAGEAATLNNIGEVYRAIGQPQEALCYYCEALPICKEIGNRSGEAATLNNIGLVYHAIGQPQEALRYYHEAQPILKEVGDRAGEATTLNNIGLVYHAIGQPQEALCYYCEALPIFKEIGDRAGEAVTLTNIGLVYAYIGQPQEALRYYREALPIHQEVGNRAMEATTLNNIGKVYRAIGQPQEALCYYCEALPIFKEIGDRAGEANTLNNIGTVYADNGQPQEALRYYREALPIFKEVGYRAGEATTLSNIGVVYRATGQPQEALRYYREALPICKEVGDRAGEATTLSNIGAAYHANGQPQEALRYYREALPICKEVGDRAGEAATLNNIGAVYHATGQPQEALRCYREALPIRKEVGDRAGETSTLNNMAWLFVAEGEYRQAVDLLRQVLSIAQETQTVAFEAAVLCSLAFIQGNYLAEPAKAVLLLRRSVELLKTHNLPLDAASQTLADHESLLAQFEAQLPSP